MAKLSKELNQFFFEEERSSHVSLDAILRIAGESIFGFLFVVLSLPSALPIPAPGYSIPFGVLMLILAGQLIIGREKPWLPKKMASYPIKLEMVQGFLKGGLPWLRKIEGITRPRLPFVCKTFAGKIIIGLAIALMSILMMIPIPGTNTVPAIGIFVTGFGLLEDDGAISLGGLGLCLAVILAVVAFVWGGFSLIDYIKALLGR
ncbi:MAG: exopolysaccharide biosynthesis protein [Cyanobacteria bacterium P01_A01_bin.84]